MYKLKLDGDGHVVLQDGKPVYVDADGNDVPVDVPSLYQKVLDLGKENKGHREKNKELTGTLSIFEGIEDLADYKTRADSALETVANFNEKDWLKADKVETLKRQMKDAHEAEVKGLKEALITKDSESAEIVKKKDAQIRKLLISANFARSPLFSGDAPKTMLPPEIAETYFGKNFKVEEQENGELVVRAYFSNGDPVYSRANPGEPAEFDEGIQSIFDAYPGKDKLLRTQSGGGGAGGDGDRGGGDEISKLRAQYKTAQENGDVTMMTSLKRRINEAEQKKKAA